LRFRRELPLRSQAFFGRPILCRGAAEIVVKVGETSITVRALKEREHHNVALLSGITLNVVPKHRVGCLVDDPIQIEKPPLGALRPLEPHDPRKIYFAAPIISGRYEKCIVS
jgi:hypothetical protein